MTNQLECSRHKMTVVWQASEIRVVLGTEHQTPFFREVHMHRWFDPPTFDHKDDVT